MVECGQVSTKGLNIKKADVKESGHDRLIKVMDAAEVVVVGVPTLVETVMLLTTRLGKDARPLVRAFLRQANAEVVAFCEEHLDAATAAFLRFGRGRHPAALDFGDCMAYAVASVAGMPLLFVGDDFTRTDIARA
jgi:ribonuclease VapC